MASADRGALEFRLLGPLEVRADGGRMSVEGPRQKALLALLLLHANEVIARDRLIGELWERPPESAENALHRVVSQLRKQLAAGSAGAPPLATRPPGYVLEIDLEALDLHRFERLFAEGRAALRSDDAKSAAALLREALALWRGPALADLGDLEFVRAEAARLEELRLQALEERMEVDLRLGEAGELVPELEALVAREPLRERLREQLMLALYRSGRQADALTAYREARRQLVAELGIEPGPRLRELEQAILRQDPALGLPSRPSEIRADRRRRVALAGLFALSLVALGVAGLFLLRDSGGSTPLTSVPPNSIAIIDPQTNELEDHVRVGSGPIAVAVGADAVWVVNADDGTLTRIDPDTREVARTIGTGTPATDVVVAFGSAWVANGTEGTISRIELASNAVAETFPVRRNVGLVSPVVSAIAAGSGSIWLTSGIRSVVRLNPRTGAVVATLTVPTEPVSIAYGEGAVWVGTLARRIVRIEPLANTVTATIPVSSTTIALAAGSDAVWAAVCCDAVWRIDPSTGAVEQTLSVGADPWGIALDPGAVWVANGAEGTVSRIDPGTNDVVTTIPVGHSPTDVATGFGSVWVAVRARARQG